jgi:hypothetical protein
VVTPTKPFLDLVASISRLEFWICLYSIEYIRYTIVFILYAFQQAREVFESGHSESNQARHNGERVWFKDRRLQESCRGNEDCSKIVWKTSIRKDNFHSLTQSKYHYKRLVVIA